MNRSIVFFDIDGTIWDWQRRIPDSTREAIKQLRANGHLAFICSGRARGNINSEDLLSIGFDGIIAACGCHVEMNGEVIYGQLLDEKLTRLLVDTVTCCRMPVVLEGPVRHWVSDWGFDNDVYVDYLFQSMREDAVKLGDRGRHELSISLKQQAEALGLASGDFAPDMFRQKILEKPLAVDYSDIRINKFSADVLAETDYPAIRQALDPYMDFIEHGITPDLDEDQGQTPAAIKAVIEVVPKGFSKASGIRWLCDRLGIDLADAYAVGDSANDIEMLGCVGHGIAMGNGTEEVRKLAEFVTADLHDDGISKALKHYSLI